MEIYEENLWQFFKRSQNQIPISMSERFQLFEKIWEGLNHLQNNGFYHLDIKLSNILIKIDSITKQWDGKNLVISDFGIGGRDLAILGKSGTPGFASPEQLIGQPHKKSDNYGFGRVLVYLFCDWNTAWDSLFQPITEAEFQALNPTQLELELFQTFKNLTKVN